MSKLLLVGKMAVGFATGFGVTALVKPKLDEMQSEDSSKFEKVCVGVAKMGILYAISGLATTALCTVIDNTAALISSSKKSE